MENYKKMSKIVVITGASSGIGRATARMMADRGEKVYDLSRSEKPQDGVEHIYCDVTKMDTVEAAIGEVAKREGRIDLLILSAGMGVAGAIEFTTEQEMHRQFDVNTYGPIRVVQHALKVMRTQEQQGRERGRIVFISSMAGPFTIPYQGMYSASKAAVNSFAWGLRNELRAHHITVTSVLPNDVQTNFQRTTDLNGLDVYPNMKTSIEKMIYDEAHGLTSEQVAKRVVKASTRKSPGLYYTSDWLSDLEQFAMHLFPASWVCRIVGMMYKV